MPVCRLSPAALAMTAVLFAHPSFAATYLIEPDGSGDFPTIADALEVAVAGDTVLLAPGTHEIEERLVLADGVVLAGSTGNRADVIVRADNASESISVNGGGQTIRDFTYRAAFIGITHDGTGLLTLENLVVADASSRAMNQGPNGDGAWSIEDCWFTNNGEIGFAGNVNALRCFFYASPIGLRTWGELRLEECEFEENGASLIQGSSFSDIRMLNCVFSDNTGNYLCLATGVTDSLVVDGCEFYDNDGGLRVLGVGSPQSHARIVNCYVDGNATLWMDARRFETAIVDNCQAEYMDRGTLYLRSMSYADVTNCSFSNCATPTLFFQQVAFPTADLCTFSGGGNAILAFQTDRLELDCKLLVTNCEFTDCGSMDTNVYAGGVHCQDEAIIRDCRFIRCHSNLSGGAISTVAGEVVRCYANGCTADVTGGGIVISEGTIRDCTFEGGSASDGSVLHRKQNDPTPATAVIVERSILRGLTPALSTASELDELALDCAVVYPLNPFDPVQESYLDSQPNGFPFDVGYCDPTSVPTNSVASPSGQCVSFGSETLAACAAYGIYVESDPPGVPITGGGVTVPGGGYFPATIGQPVELTASEVYAGPDGRGLRFSGWSDGETERTRTVTIGSYDDTFTAVYDEEVLFELEVVGGGGTVIGPTTGYYPVGTVIGLEAVVPDSGYVWEGWTGEGEDSYSGLALQIQLTLDSYIKQTATFQGFSPVLIQTFPAGIEIRVDGKRRDTPFEAIWPHGDRHTFTANFNVNGDPGVRYRFIGWVSGSPRTHEKLVGPAPVLDTIAYRTQYLLTTEAGDNGRIVASDGPWVFPGRDVQLSAFPDPGFEFVGWIGTGPGSYTGTDPSITVTMDGPITQRAEFAFVSKEGGQYDFTLSASDSNPFEHTSTAAGGLREIHLWMTCTNVGLSAFEARVATDAQVLGFDPAPGVLAIGAAPELLLAVGGCPVGFQNPFRLGSILIIDDGTTVCLERRPTTGVLGAVNCSQIEPELTDLPRVTGFSSLPLVDPCEIGINGCDQPISVRLSQLRAEAGDRKVHVRWQTTSEVDHAGFRIYRSAGINGPWDLISGEELFVGSSPYDFADTDVLPDRRYFYEVGAIDTRGVEDRYGPVEITTPEWRQLVTALAPIRPNPFVRQADIAFSMATPGPAKLEIFDVTGRLVRRLVDGVRAAGEHVATWDGRDGRGQVVPAGVYFSRFEAGGVQQSKKIVKVGVR